LDEGFYQNHRTKATIYRELNARKYGETEYSVMINKPVAVTLE